MCYSRKVIYQHFHVNTLFTSSEVAQGLSVGDRRMGVHHYRHRETKGCKKMLCLERGLFGVTASFQVQTDKRKLENR